MRIGSITIQWTKTVEAKAKEDKAVRTMDTRMTARLLDENTTLRQRLHRWGLDEGLIDRGASGKPKTPKGAGAVL